MNQFLAVFWRHGSPMVFATKTSEEAFKFLDRGSENEELFAVAVVDAVTGAIDRGPFAGWPGNRVPDGRVLKVVKDYCDATKTPYPPPLQAPCQKGPENVG